MRKIKFRAWDIISKEMIYLNEGFCSIPYYEIFCHTPDTRPWELMQFTGLLCNGKEIWEGDIVKFRILLPVEKRENANLATGSIKYCGASFFIDCQTFAFALTNNVEVIGNIYENPDLLKEGHQ